MGKNAKGIGIQNEKWIISKASPDAIFNVHAISYVWTYPGLAYSALPRKAFWGK